jgi:hypothetical protein
MQVATEKQTSATMIEHVEYTMYPPDFELESTMSIAARRSSYKRKRKLVNISKGHKLCKKKIIYRLQPIYHD